MSPTSSLVCKIIDHFTFALNGTVSTLSEEAACVPIVDGKETDEVLSIRLPANINRDGEIFVTISSPITTMDKVLITQSSKVTAVKDPRVRTRRHRPPALGRKSIAVVRVSTRDSEPSDDAETLWRGLFGENEINFRTQYEACSFGKLQFYPAEVGVLDVLVDDSISMFKSGAALVHAAQSVMKKEMGIRDVSKVADKVLVCLPPGTGNWVASSGVNHWRAQFNDGWCRSLTATMVSFPLVARVPFLNSAKA